MTSSLAISPSLSVSTSFGQHPKRSVVCQASFDAKQASPQSDNACRVKNVDFNRRQILSTASGAFLFSLSPAAIALLEADDDEALLEKVKEDRKKKITKRREVNAFKEETAFVQAAIYQLSKTGQALDGNDFASASKILGEKWISNVVNALSKVSSSTEEQSEADIFSTALASLQSAVSKQDGDLSKSSFVKSAGALERWSYLTGFAEQLKGL